MSVPTAEEFLKKYENDTDHYADQDYSEFRLIRALQEFAKLHVAEALYIASERTDLTDCDNFPHIDYVKKSSILDSYPLDNVK